MGGCLDSVRKLDYPADRIEVIVVDGCSRDGTREIALQHRVRLATNTQEMEPVGRKLGVDMARGSLVAFTDADCLVDPHWLRNSLAYFADETVAGVGGINLTPEHDSRFAKAVGFIFSQPLFSGGSYYARILKEVRAVGDLPWCNAVYRRAILTRALASSDPATLVCTDIVINRSITAMGYTLLYAPDVRVWHYRRSNPIGLFIQMHKYARGRLQLGRASPEMLQPMHLLAGLAIPIFMGGGIGLLLVAPRTAAFFFGVGFLVVWWFCVLAFWRERSAGTALCVPLVIATMMLGWSSGFLHELLFPYQGSLRS